MLTVSSDYSAYLAVCEEAARTAGKIQREKLGTVSVRFKSNPNDLVTEADTASQAAIEKIILTAFPCHRFIGEEGNLTALSQQGTARITGEYCWIVDPLDGTTNFVHTCPMFGPSIALTRGTDILCGVFYNPMTEELFSAAKGGGAFLNGKRIQTSTRTSAREALVSVSFASQTDSQSPDLQTFLKALPVCQALRRTGATALNLAYVAAGRFDATWAYTCHPWDIAAGIILVTEAGGVAGKPDGSPFDFNDPSPVCASANETLHKDLMKTING
ncbi:MAG: inositol monophosphatase [Planctomycetaceae bacterium]|nr:inositol monophosphatase [Planctomycetaceae bacterium]